MGVALVVGTEGAGAPVPTGVTPGPVVYDGAEPPVPMGVTTGPVGYEGAVGMLVSV